MARWNNPEYAEEKKLTRKIKNTVLQKSKINTSSIYLVIWGRERFNNYYLLTNVAQRTSGLSEVVLNFCT